MTGAVEKVNDLFELRDGEVGDFGAVKVVKANVVVAVVRRRRKRRRVAGRGRKESNEMLHAFQTSRSSFLNC